MTADRKLIYLDDAIAAFEGWGLRHPSGMPADDDVVTALRALPAVAPDVKVKPPYDFDRYINGIKMAEGVTIEFQTDIASACREAARIASKGPNGEAPVLVLAVLETAPADPLGAEWMRREALHEVDALLLRRPVAKEVEDAIARIPGPTEADLDAAALERPKVKALVSQEMRDRLSEIIAWHQTGLLTGEALRTYAKTLPGAEVRSMGECLRTAEEKTLLDAARILALLDERQNDQTR